MSFPREAKLVQLPRGPAVVLVILTASELAKVERFVQTSSKGAAVGVMNLDLNGEGARRSIRKVGETDLSYMDVVGEKLEDHIPRTRHRLQLGRVWSSLHAPTQDQEEAFRESISVVDTATGEVWSGKLPDGRVVAMREPHESTVREALTAAEHGRSNIAGSMDAGRRHIVSIDGEPVAEGALSGGKWDRCFSAVDTVLLGLLFGEATGAGEAPKVGNAA